MRFFATLFALVILCQTIPPTQAQLFHAIDLGTLGNSDTTSISQWNSEASALTDRNHIVGQSDFAGNESHAFFYNGTRMKLLDERLRATYAVGINRSGSVVGSYGNNAFLYQNGNMIDLELLLHAKYPSASTSVARSINDQGDVVGAFSGEQVEGTSDAFIYHNNTVTDLGIDGIATHINNKGEIIGTSSSGTFWYHEGSIEIIPMSYATAINQRGQIVGFIGSKKEVPHASMYYEGKLTDLGTLLGIEGELNRIAGPVSEAKDINDNGEVVGWSNSDEVGPGSPGTLDHGFLYRNGKLIDLDKQADMPKGWIFNVGNAITNAEEIVGKASFKGIHHAFLLLPIAVLGDMNGDGQVTIADAVLVLRAVVGLFNPTSDQMKAGDMDEDGRLSAEDAVLILRRSVGL